MSMDGGAADGASAVRMGDGRSRTGIAGDGGTSLRNLRLLLADSSHLTPMDFTAIGKSGERFRFACGGAMAAEGLGFQARAVGGLPAT
jgi:hypothetical protein